MGTCDTGRCCKGAICTDDKRCCCTAGKKGVFTANEVCRTASCEYGGGNCDDNVNVCECESNGGTLAQSCDPCANVACPKCQVCRDGQCVSTCSACQSCDTSTINGTCVDKCTGGGSVSPVTCGACQSCVCGECVVTGQLCGFPIATCCSASECCVSGTCVPCDCTGLTKPTPCHVCQSGQYVNSCASGQHCCNGACSECSDSSHCPGGSVCVNCECVPPACCVYVPACGPHGVLVITGSYTCSDVTYDYMGSPCLETRYPLDCADSDCTYTWNGSQWAFEACSVTTTQGLLLFPNDTCCTSSGCPATLSAPPGSSVGERAFGVSCENPLP